jgi:hypothetical protein
MQLALINLPHHTRDGRQQSHDPAALLGHDKKLLLNIVSCPTVPANPGHLIGWKRHYPQILVRKWHFWGKL